MRSPTNRPSEAFLSDGLCHTQIHLFYASGHLVCGKPICAAPHTITGAVWGGKLTALQLDSEDLRVVQVPGRDVPALPPHLRKE